jgi:hypothetical protein
MNITNTDSIQQITNFWFVNIGVTIAIIALLLQVIASIIDRIRYHGEQIIQQSLINYYKNNKHNNSFKGIFPQFYSTARECAHLFIYCH